MSEKKKVYKCGNCGSIVNDSDNNCGECGKSLKSIGDKINTQAVFVQVREDVNNILGFIKNRYEDVKTDKDAANILAQVLKTKYKATIKI